MKEGALPLISFERHTDVKAPDMAPLLALYRESFPLHEQRLPADWSLALADDAFHCLSVLHDGAFAGLLCAWSLENWRYIEHFAILPAMRGQGMGAQALDAYCARHPQVVLEIDPPVDETSIRRLGFYERCGFVRNPYDHLHPAYRPGYAPHALVLMSIPRAMRDAEYAAFAHALRVRVMRSLS